MKSLSISQLVKKIARMILENYGKHIHFYKYAPNLNGPDPFYFFSTEEHNVLLVYDVHDATEFEKILEAFFSTFGYENSVLLFENVKTLEKNFPVKEIIDIYHIVKISNHKKRQRELRKVIKKAKKYENIAIVIGLSHQVDLEDILNKEFKTEFRIPTETKKLLLEKLNEVYRKYNLK